MNIEEAIQDLQDIGHFLNHRLGTDSYEIRCKIYDIREMLMKQVEKTVVLADVIKNEVAVCHNCNGLGGVTLTDKCEWCNGTGTQTVL